MNSPEQQLKKSPDLKELQKQVKTITTADKTFKMPSISDIYNDSEMHSLQKDSALQVLLNQPPKPEWLKDHPTAKKEIINEFGQKIKVPIKYIPVERIEWLLINIFLRYKVEVKEYKLIANSISVAVRLHYYDHVLREWHWHDGLGAQPLQTDSGAGAVDFDKIKSNAVQIALPAAESYAVKDAAEKIGKIFGKDLNRAENNISYDSLTERYAKAFE